MQELWLSYFGGRKFLCNLIAQLSVIILIAFTIMALRIHL